MPWLYVYDWTYILVIIGAIFSLIASACVKATFSKYSKVGTSRGYSAEQAAQRILQRGGASGVMIGRINGDLTDNYNPSSKQLSLSSSVYGSGSIAAIGVAAHECGHALQDNEDYIPLKLRSAIVPVANIGSRAAWPLVILGLLFSWDPLISIGIFCFCFAVLFQLVTLPVEINASRRATSILKDEGILTNDELKGAKAVLRAAAMTYIAAAAVSILQLLRLILIKRNRR